MTKPRDPNLYIAPRVFVSKHQKFLDMKIGEALQLPMVSWRASKIVTALHKNKTCLVEHRRYSVKSLPPSELGQAQCLITRQS